MSHYVSDCKVVCKFRKIASGFGEYISDFEKFIQKFVEDNKLCNMVFVNQVLFYIIVSHNDHCKIYFKNVNYEYRIINISKHTSILKFFYLNVQNECLYAVNHIFLCALNTLNAFERFKISS